jgi:DNA-binding CsgD family transcriptional regulator
MTYLNLRHAQQLSAAFTPFYHELRSPNLPQQLAGSLVELLGLDTTCFDALDPAGRLNHVGGNAPDYFPPGQLVHMAARISEHPLYAPALREGLATPLRLTDFVSANQHRRRAYYNDFYRPLHLVYQMSVLLPVPGRGLVACTLARSTRDFTETERTLLAFAQPHLSALLQLSAPPTAPATAFTTAPRPPLPGLTPREMLILEQASQGQPDKLIAECCGISPRTVHNHLRSIYAKLGVPNRTAAARRLRGA